MCFNFDYSVNINKKIDTKKLFGNFFVFFCHFFDILATGGPQDATGGPQGWSADHQGRPGVVESAYARIVKVLYLA